MAEPLTVLVPTKNEAHNLRPCLTSVQALADEILVADSGSTDETLSIAAEFGAKIISREYIHSASMKNWAIPQAAHPWVLVVDADERVSPELAHSVRAALQDPSADAFRMRRDSFVFGHRIRFCGWQDDHVVRLFRRACRYDDRRVHAALDVPSSRVADLAGALLHYTYRDASQFMAKLERYTTLSAQDLNDRGVRASLARLVVRPPARFVKQYVLRQGFRDGVPGLLVCGFAAVNVFLKYAKLWIKQNGSPHADQPPPAPPAARPSASAARGSGDSTP